MLCPSAHGTFQFQFIHQSSCSRYLNAVNAQKPTAATADPQLAIQLLIRTSLHFPSLFHPFNWIQMAPSCPRLPKLHPSARSYAGLGAGDSNPRQFRQSPKFGRPPNPPPNAQTTILCPHRKNLFHCHQPPPPSANVVHHLQAACPHLIRYRFPGKWRLFPAASPQSHRGSWRLHVSTNSTTLFFSLDLC